MISNQSALEIIDQKGRKQVVEVIMTFTLEQTKKEYIIYTLNEKNNDRVILYDSSILDKNGQIFFENIADEEWLLVKNQMYEVIKNEGDQS